MTTILDENQEQITLYLPSNVPCPFFENKTSHFVTVLNKPLKLKPDAKIALAEILYPSSILNVYEPINHIIFRKGKGVAYSRYLKSSYYSTTQELIRAIHSEFPSEFSSRIRYDKVSQSLKFAIHPDETIELRSGLAQMLGFVERTKFPFVPHDNLLRKQGPKIYRADVAPDVNLLTYSLFIYTDIVRDSVVGNTTVPLIGCIHVANNNLEKGYTHYVVPLLHFVKLNTSYLEKIEIRITDSTGENAKFSHGKCMVRLVITQTKDING